MDERICPVCGTTFQPRTWNQKYCTGYRGQCYRRAMNVAYHGGTLDAPLPAPFDCAHCGKHCTPGQNVDTRATRFCDQTCRTQWRIANRPDRQPDPLREANARDVGAYQRALRADPCAYCGAPSEASDHIVPRSHGGPDDWTNRTGACHACNGAKMQTPLLVFLAWKQARDAFEPWRAIVASIHTRAAA